MTDTLRTTSDPEADPTADPAADAPARHGQGRHGHIDGAGAGIPDGPIRAPWTPQKKALAWSVGVFVALVPISLWQIELSPGNLLDGWQASESFRSRVWPPSFVGVGDYVSAMVETVMMVVVATFVATVLSIPVGFMAVTNTTVNGTVQSIARGIIVMWRAIPDIVIAIVFRLLVGIGPLAGVIAMALHSIGMLGKLFAEAIEEIDQGPMDALEASGASRLQVYATAVLPQVMSAWIGIILYRFDINIRVSVILGFVGAGGIGFLLKQQQGQLSWGRVLATAFVIFVFIVILEQLSNLMRRALLTEEQRSGGRQTTRISDLAASALPDLRAMVAGTVAVQQPWTAERRRKWGYGAVAAVLVLAGFVYVGSRPLAWNWSGFGAFWSNALPPNFLDRWEIVLPNLLDTFWMAIGATFFGVLISIPFGILGARNASPNGFWYWAARLSMLANRGLPEIVLAIFFVVLLGGLGPVAGFFTLTVAAIGFTGKLMADQIEENVKPGPVRALDSVGASWWQKTATGVWPQAVPGFVATALYTFDVNFRAATILGIVGAGGIGASLFEAFQGFDYDRMFAIIIEIFVVVFLVEKLSVWLRAKLI